MAKQKAAQVEPLEKRQELNLEAILNQPLIEPDFYHQGLAVRLKEVDKYLKKVVRGQEALNVREIPKILDLLPLPTNLRLFAHYKICRDEYRNLMYRCFCLNTGPAMVLMRQAYAVWDKLLSLPKFEPSATLILNVLSGGLITPELKKIICRHKQKFVDCGLDGIIKTTAQHLLNDGVYMDRKGQVKRFEPQQRDILAQIPGFFEIRDLRTLEEIAEDTPE